MPCRLCIERCYSREARGGQSIDLVWVFLLKAVKARSSIIINEYTHNEVRN